MKLLNEYENGNYLVKIYDDGTKERLYNETPRPITPESIDVKITNYCDAGCKWCHELSDKYGQHSDLSIIQQALNELPAGSELAIGGGNPLSHHGLLNFLEWAKRKEVIANMTINSVHLERNKKKIQTLVNNRLIYGLGISYNPAHLDKGVYDDFFSDNLVFHLISGLHEISELDKIINRFNKVKVLVLGYKKKGRGEEYLKEHGLGVETNIKEWYTKIGTYFSNKKILVSFDNLAIEQLNIKELLPDPIWNRIYMGDDGQYTMYIDAVKQQYAVSSTNKERYSLSGKGIIEMFKNVREISREKDNS